MDYATILNKMIDHAFGDCEQYIGQLRNIKSRYKNKKLN